MLDYAFVRFIVAGLVLATWGVVDGLSNLFAWGHTMPRARRPILSHLAGFVSLILFYGAIGKEGGAIQGGLVNQVALLLAGLAMAIRFATRRGSTAIRYPDLASRTLFFAALPLVVGSYPGLLALTLPQALIAADLAMRRDRARKSGETGETAARNRRVPGIW